MKIEKDNYQAINLGSYETIKEGDEVYFCGYQLLTSHHTINHGIVSTLFIQDSKRFIQIDGSVNSGNSDGPLLNMNDKVIGIITQKMERIDDRLVSLADRLTKSYGPVSVTEPSSYDDNKITLPHTNKTLAVFPLYNTTRTLGSATNLLLNMQECTIKYSIISGCRTSR